MNNTLTATGDTRNGLLPAKRDRSYLIWSFLIPFTFMLLIYALDGVFPFGNNSVLVLDLNGQYVGFYEALRAFVYGDGSLLYSFSRSLGGEMMGIYAYYLASPLSYIVALFPEAYMTEALLFIFILKAGLCGLTFGIYMHRQQFCAPYASIMLSTLYALSSFAIVMQHNSMWIDNLILLPLLTLGIEAVVKHRRYRLFVFSLALSLLSNFYIGFMTCIYTLLYFFYYFYAFSEGGKNDPLHEKQHYLRSLVRMALYSLLAIAIAAIILLTVIYSLSFGKTTFTDPSYLPKITFNPLQFFAKLLPGVYDTVEPEGFPFVYCGVLTLLLVPLYFANRRLPRVERIVSGIFLSVFYISMSISSLDMLWHGGQAPNWLNYRYSFFLCFILLVLAARAYARLDDIKPRTIVSVLVVLGALVAVTLGAELSFFKTEHAVLAFAIMAVITALLVGIRKSGGRVRQYLSMLLLCLVLAECLYNGNVMLAKLHEDVGATTRDEYQGYHETTGSSINWLKENDTSFYRTEVLYHRVTNDAMELGYRGLTNSTSTLNAKTIQFLYRMGLLSTSHWSEYYGSTLVLDSLLGIRYVLTAPVLGLNDVYERYHEDQNNAIHRNPYALPIAFAASEAVKGYDMSPLISPLARQNDLLRALLGKTEEADCYLPLEAEVSYEKLLCETEEHGGIEYFALYSDVFLENEEGINNGTVSLSGLKEPESKISFTTTVQQDGPLYFYIATDYLNEMEMFVDDAYYGTIYGSNDDFVKGLGDYTAGEQVKITLRMDECSFFLYPTDAVVFYQEDTETATRLLSALGTNGIVLDSFTEDSFLGSITTTAERPVVQTTIPYDAGWIVTVDGVRVNTYETLDALLAFDTAPGEHTVEMVYRPTCYVLGKTISLIALVLLVALIVIEELWRRGVLKPAEGSLPYRLLDLFFYAGRVPAEPNYLSNEEIERAEAARAPKITESAEGKEGETAEAEAEDAEKESEGDGHAG